MSINYNYLRNKSILITTGETSSLTTTDLSVISPDSSDSKILLYNDDKLIVVSADSGNAYPITLASDFRNNDTRITFDSYTFPEIIPNGSLVILEQTYFNNSLFRKNSLQHLHLYQQGNTHGNDLLMAFTQFNFNVNAGSILATGNSKGNNWGARYGFFNAPHNGCQVERINYKFTTNAGAGETFVFSLWKKPVTENGTAATQLTLIDSFTISSQNNAAYVFSGSVTPSASLGALNSNDVIIPSIKKEDTKVSSTKLYGDIELLVSFDPRTSVI